MSNTSTTPEDQLDGYDVRRSMALANANAALWALGNGLISTQLVIFLANELGATGLAISMILAAPRFAGLLRLCVPALMARLAARKSLCIVSYLLSAAILCVVPAAAVAQQHFTAATGVALLVAAWCSYHVAEYAGTVTLWSWLGDLTPTVDRGVWFGRRESWLSAGRIVGLVVSAALPAFWSWRLPQAPRWQPLALSAALGAVMMALATAPLVFMPGLSHAPSAVPRTPWRAIGRAFLDPVYARLLLFHFWFSIANGISAAAQEVYPIRVLGFTFTGRQVLQGVMRSGQLAIAPKMGQLVDRWGNRPVMIVSQLIVALGPLFFLAATPAHPWIVAGAFIVWIAYAGLNVGLDNVKIKLAAPENNSPFVAAYYAVADFANGVTVIFGGWALDHLGAKDPNAGAMYTKLFVAGFVARVLAIPLLAWLIEPGARRVREMVAPGRT